MKHFIGMTYLGCNRGWTVLNFWRFQPQIVLKLFLFFNFFENSVSGLVAHTIFKGAKKYVFVVVSKRIIVRVSYMNTTHRPEHCG